MSHFLDKIVSHIQQDLEQAEKTLSLKDLIKTVSPRQGRRTFADALSDKSSVNIIAEIKRASPSKGDIDIDLDPGKTASDYEKGGAKCLSVLTEPAFFKGSFEDLEAARQACSLPVLRKDFIISARQVYESCKRGADCILLIAKILSPQELKTLHDLADALNMDALVEIHSEDEIGHVDACNATLVGINNRNLNSFDTDTANAVSLVSKLGKDRTIVAASGIADRQAIEANLIAGINNFLIGESLVRSDNTIDFLQQLIRG